MNTCPLRHLKFLCAIIVASHPYWQVHFITNTQTQTLIDRQNTTRCVFVFPFFSFQVLIVFLYVFFFSNRHRSWRLIVLFPLVLCPCISSFHLCIFSSPFFLAFSSCLSALALQYYTCPRKQL